MHKVNFFLQAEKVDLDMGNGDPVLTKQHPLALYTPRLLMNVQITCSKKASRIDPGQCLQSKFFNMSQNRFIFPR